MAANSKRIFFTYSSDDDDELLYKELSPYFLAYKRKGLLDIIDKDELFRLNGDPNKISEFLSKSDLAIQLISVDYLNSDECLQLLEKATAENKKIVPVLLRPCDWESEDKLRRFKEDFFPENNQSIKEFAESPADKERIFTELAQVIKQLAFPELGHVKITKGPKTFYILLASILLLMGALSAVFVYVKLAMGLTLSLIVFLMFGCAALFALKNVLFPTQIKIS
ncbi:MAG: hypothetical protein JNJ58_01930 [Chitinophagaceae bacterium]|nr:hypothetical protein [Chitinophagaceae bacterium]